MRVCVCKLLFPCPTRALPSPAASRPARLPLTVGPLSSTCPGPRPQLDDAIAEGAALICMQKTFSAEKTASLGPGAGAGSGAASKPAGGRASGGGGGGDKPSSSSGSTSTLPREVQNSLRAVQCALELVKHSNYTTGGGGGGAGGGAGGGGGGGGEPVTLSLHVGIGCGDTNALHVGGVEGSAAQRRPEGGGEEARGGPLSLPLSVCFVSVSFVHLIRGLGFPSGFSSASPRGAGARPHPKT